MIRFMSTQKNTASTDRQNGGHTMTDFIIAKNTLEFTKQGCTCQYIFFNRLDDME